MALSHVIKASVCAFASLAITSSTSSSLAIFILLPVNFDGFVTIATDPSSLTLTTPLPLNLFFELLATRRHLTTLNHSHL